MSEKNFLHLTHNLRLPGLLSVFALLLGLICNHPAFAQTPTLDSEERAFVNLLNQYRLQNGITMPLQVSVRLTNAAKWMSNDMIQYNYFDHFDHLGRDPYTRMANFGYAYNTAKAENIAAGNSTAAATFEQWRNSPGHNQNMLNPAFRTIGIGRATGGAYGWYWTNKFGGYVDQTVPMSTISPTGQAFAANGGTGSITVTAPAGHVWTATSNNPSFIVILSGVGGSGPGTVTYQVFPHSANTPRSGTITVDGLTFTVYQGARFNDIPATHPFYTEIGKLSARAVTQGCGSGNYCPDATVTREQMAAFIIRALHEPGYTLPTPGTQRFTDIPPSHPFYTHIEEMAVRSITLGCGGGSYCPGTVVTREQMSAFIIRALHSPGYIPPTPGTQRFADVPPTHPFYAHIEEMAVRGITSGCGGGNYCPTSPVSRAQMAAFLVRAFGL